MSNGVSQREAETGKGKKTWKVAVVRAWRDHVRGFKELDPSACARFAENGYARRVNEKYTAQPFARGLRPRKKGARRRRVLGSKATPFHTAGATFPTKIIPQSIKPFNQLFYNFTDVSMFVI